MPTGWLKIHFGNGVSRWLQDGTTSQRTSTLGVFLLVPGCERGLWVTQSGVMTDTTEVEHVYCKARLDYRLGQVIRLHNSDK